MSGKIIESKLEVNQNALLPEALKEAYKVSSIQWNLSVYVHVCVYRGDFYLCMERDDL